MSEHDFLDREKVLLLMEDQAATTCAPSPPLQRQDSPTVRSEKETPLLAHTSRSSSPEAEYGGSTEADEEERVLVRIPLFVYKPSVF